MWPLSYLCKQEPQPYCHGLVSHRGRAQRCGMQLFACSCDWCFKIFPIVGHITQYSKPVWSIIISKHWAIGLSHYTANCWIRTEGAREVLVAQLRHWLSPISPTLQMWQENLEFIMFHQIQVSRNLLQRKHLCSVVLWHPTHWPLGNLLSSSEGATVFSGGRKGIWNKVWNWQSFWNLLKVDMDKQRTKW